ncbi:hypothetical protein [Actinophytocola gossypii]|uniref:SRPBCC family protein n=1 Tax=Actinophytocola gossypii TaxID=2812003 RepID=A0ABT2JIY3_9PSEU|nr:hypothetical protein [Actinophytocola gossypii]MCT2587350.1 hypothetical protein [Actinophytocola gossypii]
MFRRAYDLVEDDHAVTELTGFRRESCEFTVDDQRLRVDRERGKRFVLSGPVGRIASADRETGRRWAITTAAGRLELERPSTWRSAWELRRGGVTVGRFEHRGVFSWTATGDVSAELPLPVRVFAFYVVLMLWERAAATAAAASS